MSILPHLAAKSRGAGRPFRPVAQAKVAGSAAGANRAVRLGKLAGITFALGVALSGCGALDDSAPAVADPQACPSVEDRLQPLLEMAAGGHLQHVADLIEHELDPASQRALLVLLLDIGKAMPPGTLQKTPQILADLDKVGLVAVLVALLEPLAGDPAANPPQPAHLAELQAFSNICRTCLDQDLFVLSTQLFRDPRLPPLLLALLAEAEAGAPQLRAVLEQSGSQGRAGFSTLVRSTLLSLSQTDSDAEPLVQAVDALVDPQNPGVLGAVRDLLVLAVREADGQTPSPTKLATVRKLAACLTKLDPQALLAGHLYDVLLAGVPLPVVPPGEVTQTAERLELLAYASEELSTNAAARDAWGQILGLALQPDLAVATIPELVTLMESPVLADLFALISDLLLQPCSPHSQDGGVP